MFDDVFIWPSSKHLPVIWIRVQLRRPFTCWEKMIVYMKNLDKNKMRNESEKKTCGSTEASRRDTHEIKQKKIPLHIFSEYRFKTKHTFKQVKNVYNTYGHRPKHISEHTAIDTSTDGKICSWSIPERSGKRWIWEEICSDLWFEVSAWNPTENTEHS